MTAGDRQWGGSGSVTLPEFDLSEDDHDALVQATNLSAGSPLAREFTQAIRLLIRVYLGAKHIADQSTPAATRAEFLALRNAMLKVNKLLDAAGGNTRLIMLEIGGEDDYDGQKALAERMITVFTKGLEVARQYPAAGALVDHPALELARGVARAMLEICGIRPTATRRGSKYMEVLEIVMAAATGKEPKALHTLVRRALAAERGDAEGPKAI